MIFVSFSGWKVLFFGTCGCWKKHGDKIFPKMFKPSLEENSGWMSNYQRNRERCRKCRIYKNTYNAFQWKFPLCVCCSTFMHGYSNKVILFLYRNEEIIFIHPWYMLFVEHFKSHSTCCFCKNLNTPVVDNCTITSIKLIMYRDSNSLYIL